MILTIFIIILLVCLYVFTTLIYRCLLTWLFRKNWFLALYEYIYHSNTINIPIQTKKLYEDTHLDNRKKLLNYTVVTIIYLAWYLVCFMFICIYLVLRYFNIINHQIDYLDVKILFNFSILHVLFIFSIIDIIFQFQLLISMLIKSWKWTLVAEKKIKQIAVIEDFKIEPKKDIDLSQFNINSRKNYYIYSIKINKFSPKSIVKVDFEYFKQKYGLELTKNLFETFFWLIENNKLESKTTFSYLENLEILYFYNLTQFK